MKLLTGRFTVHGEYLSEFKQLLNEYREWCSKQEGCASCFCYQDLQQDYVFAYVSEWRDREALIKHIRSAEFVPFFEAFKLLTIPATIRFSLILYNDVYEAIKAEKDRKGYL